MFSDMRTLWCVWGASGGWFGPSGSTLLVELDAVPPVPSSWAWAAGAVSDSFRIASEGQSLGF